MTSVIDYLIALAKCTPAEHMVSDTEHSVVKYYPVYSYKIYM